MGRRKSKCQNSSCSMVTNHERWKVKMMEQYGDQDRRLHKESVADFDQCNITLKPCEQPVISEFGVIGLEIFKN